MLLLRYVDEEEEEKEAREYAQNCLESRQKSRLHFCCCCWLWLLWKWEVDGAVFSATVAVPVLVAAVVGSEVRDKVLGIGNGGRNDVVVIVAIER